MVKKVLKEKVEEEQKKGSAVRVRRHIMERISHGYDSAAYPVENLMELDGRDKEWVARVVKREGALYRDN